MSSVLAYREVHQENIPVLLWLDMWCYVMYVRSARNLKENVPLHIILSRNKPNELRDST